MALSATLKYTSTIAGVVTTRTDTVTAAGSVSISQSLGTAKSGTLTTRTDNDTGVITLAGGHGLATSDVVDVYWTGGSRHGITASVSTNALSIDLGTGDNLPTQGTAVTVCEQSVFDLDVAGDDLKALSASLATGGYVEFQENDGTSLLAIDLTSTTPYLWFDGSGVTNPLAGEAVGKIVASNRSTTAADVKVTLLIDNVA